MGSHRSGATAPPLAPGDYLLALARPRDLGLLDRLFGPRPDRSKADARGLLGEFSFERATALAAIAHLYDPAAEAGWGADTRRIPLKEVLRQTGSRRSNAVRGRGADRARHAGRRDHAGRRARSGAPAPAPRLAPASISATWITVAPRHRARLVSTTFFTLLIPLVQTAGHAENLVKPNPIKGADFLP
jgi:hypothetical protein